MRDPGAGGAGDGTFVGGEVFTDADAGDLLVGDVVEEAVDLRLGVENGALGTSAKDVEEDEGGNGDKKARHGSHEHFTYFGGECRQDRKYLYLQASLKAPIMPQTVPVRPIMGETTPMTER